MTFSGIGVAIFSGIILYQNLRESNPQSEEAAVIDTPVGAMKKLVKCANWFCQVETVAVPRGIVGVVVVPIDMLRR